MRLLAITCDILSRPVYFYASRSPHAVNVVHLGAALHTEPMSLRERIQEQIDAADPRLDGVVLAYGLCGGATAGLVARGVPIVLPRAHDCVTIFLGGRDRYQAEHEATPGTYWYVQDQMDRGNDLKGWLLGDAARSEDAVATRAEYVQRYGADNADFLMEALGEWSSRYERGAFLDTGLGSADEAAERARAEAEGRGWRFERKLADLQIVRRLLFGEWNEDFQVLQPGERLAMSFDDDVVRVAQPESSSLPER
ncbi:MAG TPA: DUF1638 domain-containing protein [Candidatus Sulfomarinibacteraceae bacterium]|nr:DUF1638 domain-containing protein [Candidatus Sulfomarinibacteraceae bacterium]